jgi:hypothetical protein
MGYSSDMRVPRWARRLWSMAIAFGRVKAVLTALGLWGFISASLVHFSKSLWRDPAERWVLGVSIGLLVTVGILILIERLRRLPEGRAALVPRYDPNADPPRYEAPFRRPWTKPNSAETLNYAQRWPTPAVRE